VVVRQVGSNHDDHDSSMERMNKAETGVTTEGVRSDDMREQHQDGCFATAAVEARAVVLQDRPLASLQVGG